MAWFCVGLFGGVEAQAAGGARAPNVATPVRGQLRPLEEVLASWSAFSGTQKLTVIEQLIRAGRFDVAENLLASFQPANSVERWRAQFMLGVLRKAQGRFDEAIRIFRKLLAAHPEFQRVRLELAHALYSQQEDDSARHHFELVLGSVTNPDLQKTLRGFIDAMDKRKRWNLSGYFSLAPSTNINQGSSARVVRLNGLDFVLAEQSRKKSGVGVNGGVSAGYRLPLSERLDLVVGGGAHLKRYQETGYNDTILSAEVGPRYRFKSGDVAVYGTAARRWYGGAAYSWLFGARLQTTVRLSPKDILRVGGHCQRKQFDVVDYQDGWTCGATVSGDHFLDTRSFVRVMAGFSRDKTGLKHLDYDSKNVAIGYYRELPWGLSVYGQAKYTRLDYSGVYPTAIEARNDDRLDFTLHVTKRDWQIFGFAPMAQYTYTLNQSNIGFHDYDAHGVNLTWTKKF